MNLLKRLIRALCFRTGRMRGLYIRFCRPDGLEYGQFLKQHGNFHSIGERCSIPTYANITDPYLVRMGNNVRLTACSLFCHDGSVNMLNEAFDLDLDNVGPIDLLDNVFIGQGAIVLPNVKIGPNAIVAAGAVVTRDVPEDAIVAGSPARVVGSVSEYTARVKNRTEAYPWYPLIRARSQGLASDTLENQLAASRSSYFFSTKAQ